MTRVAILTPTYRHARFIGACIESVLAQTMRDWSMIVVDDGSDDGTADRAAAFGDPRVRVLRLPHRGPSGLGRAYAAALSTTDSPFVAILEGDDMWPSRKLEEELPLFDDADVVLAYGAAGLMDEQGLVYARHRHAPRGAVGRNDPVGAILPSLVRTNFIVAATVMLRREPLESIGGFVQPDGIPYVDHPTWLRLATVGQFARSRRLLGFWRRHAGQVTTRSWIAPQPDRRAYLSAAAEDAHRVLTTTSLASMQRAVSQDREHQREEAAIARARIALLDGSWREAAASWWQLLRVGELRSRALAILGLVAAGLRTDIEGVIRIAGRHSLPSRRHTASHAARPRSGGTQ
jgi:glycosyltransferase involved in cell wall biosynthesis